VAKKALCGGINDYPGDGSDLNGCVNDAKVWAGLLVEHFDFGKGDVRLLLDREATKASMMQSLGELVGGAASGDTLVFTNSSHGTYVADTDGDEGAYDEALCPYDCEENLIVDDELRELFSKVPAGVNLTVVSDSCHSGTVTRAAISENLPVKTPDDRRVRFLHPALIGRKILSNPWKARNKTRAKHPQSKMKEILLSGCTPQEYSYDALIGGRYHGAMTYYAVKAIRDADYDLSWSQLHSRLRHLIEEAEYPQLEGATPNKKRRIFGVA
jgi:metacaspase-1